MRSTWAIVAGVLFVVVVTTLIDVLLHVVGVYPAPGQPLDDALALLATAYRIPIGVAGGWLAARLAPAEPLRHAIILGVVGTGLGALGAVMTWDRGLGPHWYPVLLTVLALPQSWAGGRLFQVRRAAAPNA